MSKRCFFTLAVGEHVKHFKIMEKTFRHFNPKEELIVFGDDEIRGSRDPEILFRATPFYAKYLMGKGYTEVCKLDADQLILGNLNHIWEGEFDVAVVNNSNPKEAAKYPVSIWDIHPLSYANAGFVVLKSKEFVEHWLSLCYSSHFPIYQMREQDLLNIILFYGNYNVKKLDEGDKYHGLASKGYTPLTKMVDGKVMLLKGEQWPDKDKQIVCYHFAGGHNSVEKMKYRLFFPEDVCKFIDGILKEEKK